MFNIKTSPEVFENLVEELNYYSSTKIFEHFFKRYAGQYLSFEKLYMWNRRGAYNKTGRYKIVSYEGSRYGGNCYGGGKYELVAAGGGKDYGPEVDKSGDKYSAWAEDVINNFGGIWARKLNPGTPDEIFEADGYDLADLRQFRYYKQFFDRYKGKPIKIRGPISGSRIDSHKVFLPYHTVDKLENTEIVINRYDSERVYEVREISTGFEYTVWCFDVLKQFGGAWAKRAIGMTSDPERDSAYDDKETFESILTRDDSTEVFENLIENKSLLTEDIGKIYEHFFKKYAGQYLEFNNLYVFGYNFVFGSMVRLRTGKFIGKNYTGKLKLVRYDNNNYIGRYGADVYYHGTYELISPEGEQFTSLSRNVIENFGGIWSKKLGNLKPSDDEIFETNNRQNFRYKLYQSFFSKYSGKELTINPISTIFLRSIADNQIRTIIPGEELAITFVRFRFDGSNFYVIRDLYGEDYVIGSSDLIMSTDTVYRNKLIKSMTVSDNSEVFESEER